MKHYTQTEMNSLGFIPVSGQPAAIITSARIARNSLGYQPDAYIRRDEGRFTGDTFSDGDMGLGKWSLKKPLGGKKSIFRKVTNVVTAPIKLAVLPVMQAVGLKSLSQELNDGLMKKKDLEAAGKVAQVAGVITAGVLLAPVVAGAFSATGATAATGGTGLLSKAGSLLSKAGPLANKVLSTLKAGAAPSYGSLTADEKASVSVEDFNALVESQKAIITAMQEGSTGTLPSGKETSATPYGLRDAVADKGSMIPAEFKPYLPYAIGGLSLIILVGVFMPKKTSAAPAALSNPRRRCRKSRR